MTWESEEGIISLVSSSLILRFTTEVKVGIFPPIDPSRECAAEDGVNTTTVHSTKSSGGIDRPSQLYSTK